MQPQNTPAQRESRDPALSFFRGFCLCGPRSRGLPDATRSAENFTCGLSRQSRLRRTAATKRVRSNKTLFVREGPRGDWAEHLSLIRIASGATRVEPSPGGCPSSREQGIPSDPALLYVASFRSSRFLFGNRAVRQIKASSVRRFSSCLPSLFPVYRTFKGPPA